MITSTGPHKRSPVACITPPPKRLLKSLKRLLVYPWLLNLSLEDYFYQNPLHFDLFPSVAQMEAEVICMVKNLYHGNYLDFVLKFKVMTMLVVSSQVEVLKVS
jgi:hypothetical protein